MKKILVALCMLTLLLASACVRQSNTENDITTSTSENQLSSEATLSVFETELTENGKTDKTELTKQDAIKKDENLTKTNQPTKKDPQQDVNEVPPYILTESLEDLRQIKTATETMSETEFVEYMDENFSTEVVNGMDNIKNAEKYLTDFEKAYVVYVDEFAEDNLMAYYTEYGDISYKISVDDEYVLSCTYSVESENSFEYKEGNIIRSLETYEINGMTIELYENTADETEGLYGNIRYNDITIPFFTNIKIDVERFEKVLPRIGVARIGDLIEE